ncbi:RNA polymerase sigma factor [Chryseobacterium sp.]|uniref:RNA polymerase sigma factor n=1 Tax=Chryseobacterium sp. TaxID=1871047 RepID=UPI00388D1279
MKSQLEIKFINEITLNQGIIHKICRIYTDNKDDHEDLFQEITIQLWRSSGNFRGEAKFSTWMYRIALNTAISLFRRNKKEISVNSDIDISTIKISQSEKEEKEERIKIMYQAIHQLSDIEKALIMLFLEDKSYREIGEILGISEGNARVKMNRARNNLKTLISKIK